VSIAFIVALALWIGFRLRAHGRPAPRAWPPALLLAGAVLAAAVAVTELLA
jgi:hypothetical protein